MCAKKHSIDAIDAPAESLTDKYKIKTHMPKFKMLPQ